MPLLRRPSRSWVATLLRARFLEPPEQGHPGLQPELIPARASLFTLESRVSFGGRCRRPFRVTLPIDGQALPRHHLRVPDERARLRADAGDARLARLRGGREPRRGRPDPLQHLLDPRVGRQPLHRPPRRGEAAQVRRPGAGRRRRRLLGAVGQGRGLPALPLRRRRLRARPDPQAGRVPQLRLAQRPGLLRVRGLLRPPADPPRARVPGLAADLPGLQLRLLLLHRPHRPAGARSAATPTS